MNIEEFREYCLLKPGVTEGFPFGEDTLVFKVMGKMFALTGLKGEFRINLKCDPERAIELRERYPSVIPGYHMNKQHWNTVIINGTVDDDMIYKWIDHSFDLIVDSLKSKDKELLRKMKEENI
jgi:predicted DNA-binding protein (MmcQ/YjbR family)